jgi:hypothetical protein
MLMHFFGQERLRPVRLQSLQAPLPLTFYDPSATPKKIHIQARIFKPLHRVGNHKFARCESGT